MAMGYYCGVLYCTEMNYNGISSAKHAAMLRRQIKQARTRIIAYLSVFSVIGFVSESCTQSRMVINIMPRVRGTWVVL